MSISSPNTSHNYGHGMAWMLQICRHTPHIMTPQTPDSADVSDREYYSEPRKMFNQRESFRQMKLFTSTKEWISYCDPHQSLSNEYLVLSNSLEGWMLNVPDKIRVTPVLSKLRCPLNQLLLVLPSIANLSHLSKVSTWHLVKTWKNCSFYSSPFQFKTSVQVTCANDTDLENYPIFWGTLPNFLIS